jgi:hypothetical protein
VTTTLNIASVMDTLAVTPSGIPKAYAFPPDAIVTPCVVVGYPTEIEYHQTFGVGNAKAVFPVWVVTGKVMEQASRDKLSAAGEALRVALDGLSLVIKAAKGTVDVITVGTVNYLALRIDCEVYT